MSVAMNTGSIFLGERNYGYSDACCLRGRCRSRRHLDRKAIELELEGPMRWEIPPIGIVLTSVVLALLVAWVWLRAVRVIL